MARAKRRMVRRRDIERAIPGVAEMIDESDIYSEGGRKSGYLAGKSTSVMQDVRANAADVVQKGDKRWHRTLIKARKGLRAIHSTLVETNKFLREGYGLYKTIEETPEPIKKAFGKRVEKLKPRLKKLREIIGSLRRKKDVQYTVSYKKRK